MKIKRIFSTIDTHTAGQPTRTIVGGIPYVPGKSISEKMLYLKEKKALGLLFHFFHQEMKNNNFLSNNSIP